MPLKKRVFDDYFGETALIVSAVIWAYLWIRAIYVPIAHDEAATFFYYIQYQDFLPWKAHWDANNHVLNSALSSILFPLTGSSTLSIRLANLLFFPLYAFYLYKISFNLKYKLTRWTFFLALIMAHHVVGFFALSRGYGMSMALMIASLFHLMELMKMKKIRHMAASLAFMALAVLANLALLNSLILLIGISSFFTVIRIKERRQMLYGAATLLGLGILPVVLFSLQSFEMKELGLFYYGSTDSFWNISLESLLSTFTDLTGWAVSFVVVIYFLFLVTSFIKRFLDNPVWGFFFEPGRVFILLLLGNLLMIQVLRWAFQVNYPEDRVGMHLVVLFSGAICFAVDDIPELKKKWIPLLPLLFFPAHFITNINTSETAVYKVDIVPEEFYDIVWSDHREGEFPPTLGGYRVRHFCWSYLDYRNGGKESQVFWADYPTHLTDFQIVENKDLAETEEDYFIIATEPVNQRHLTKRKEPVQKIFLRSSEVVSGTFDTVYRNLQKWSVEGLSGKSLYVGIDMRVSSDEEPFEAWVVAEAQDVDGNNLRYQFIALDWLRYSWKEPDNRLHNGIILHDTPAETTRILVYIWNINSVEYSIHNGTVSMFELNLP